MFSSTADLRASDIAYFSRCTILHLNNRMIGILITDHNVRETLDICERAYIVNEGEIICAGTPQVILDNPKVREVYLGHEFEL